MPMSVLMTLCVLTARGTFIYTRWIPHCKVYKTMDQVAQQYHIEDVGKILLQTQAELRQLRNAVQPNEDISSAKIEDILYRAEEDLRSKAAVRSSFSNCLN